MKINVVVVWEDKQRIGIRMAKDNKYITKLMKIEDWENLDKELNNDNTWTITFKDSEELKQRAARISFITNHPQLPILLGIYYKEVSKLPQTKDEIFIFKSFIADYLQRFPGLEFEEVKNDFKVSTKILDSMVIGG